MLLLQKESIRRYRYGKEGFGKSGKIHGAYVSRQRNIQAANTGRIDEHVACVREWIANIFF